jgi:hypothetical protein
MKRILLPFVSPLIASNIFAAPISFEDAKRARGGVPMYDVVTLSKYLDQHMGEHIAVLAIPAAKTFITLNRIGTKAPSGNRIRRKGVNLRLCG